MKGDTSVKEHCYLAVDIGATSGRVVAGFIRKDGGFEFREIHRFPNSILNVSGKFYWDIFSIYSAVLEGLCKCAAEGIRPESIGIDTWGVDFGFTGEDGVILGLPRAYRDTYTDGAPEEFYGIVPKDVLYEKTGIQILNFNSIFQLYRQSRDGFSPLKNASKLLFIPDLLSYMLTGKMVCEYTVASTSQLLNPYTKDFDDELLLAAGITREHFPEIVMPGTVIGELTDHIAEFTGLGKVKVVAVAGHDTASAVAAVPAAEKNFAYLSSGTWSLMGIETEAPIINKDAAAMNFTNEGGIDGTVRFLKNITGMWLLEQSRKEWKRQGKDYDYGRIMDMAKAGADFDVTVNPDDPRLANPESMLATIAAMCEEKGGRRPADDAETVSCIFRSLAFRYKEVLDSLKSLSPFAIEHLYIIGGGVRNRLLNKLTEEVAGVEVVEGPAEATAIGNCMVQARAAGLFSDRQDFRRALYMSNIKH